MSEPEEKEDDSLRDMRDLINEDLLEGEDDDGRAVCAHCRGSLFVVTKEYRTLMLADGKISTANEWIDDETEIKCDCEDVTWDLEIDSW